MRTKILTACGAIAACAALTLAPVAASASGTPVKNATEACGGSCVDVHFLVPGDHYLLKDHSGLTAANNVIALTTASNSMSSEDFAQVNLSKVDPAYCIGSVAVPGSVFTSRQCQLLNNAGLDFATTFQLAFNPDNGGPSTMCIGAWDNLSLVPSGYKARLEPCGVAADTVIIETAKLPTGKTTAGSDWLISGGSDNFSDPLVLSNNGGTAWQSPKWQTVNVNGGQGEDTQEIRLTPGPFVI